ncbi:TerB family tellurite resistance protein [Selenomonas sp. FC4001]|uniref:TerB family tellurite resistance protein n=1 Tax=Selenomonas sp. FC4001 TaxID=1408313 RepID=UPI00055B5C77|nr:TerB family tellurite resistance protein [Selenomonas sp. FC4001]
MGLFRFVGGALIGIALAPVTGGASLLAVGAASGTVAHVVGGWSDENEKNEARREGRLEGYNQGYVHGRTERGSDAEEKLARILENDYNLQIGAFALGLYISNVDGIDDGEIAVITEQLGAPDSTFHSEYVRSELNKCIKNIDGYDFDWICTNYLDNVADKKFDLLKGLVNDVIRADNNTSPEEQSFLDNQWYPYLRGRGINVEMR